MADGNTLSNVDTANRQPGLLRVLPLYVAAYAVLLCGLGAYAATNSDDRFGFNGTVMILCGFCVSLFCRQQRLRQNTVFGILAALIAVLVFWVSVGAGAPLPDLLAIAGSERTSGPGTMLAWFVVLYSFAMIADEVIVFSVVPSIALLGLMASENLNPEIVVYFLGLVLSAVFLLVYDNMLGHMPGAEALGTPAAEGIELGGDGTASNVRAPLLLAVCVLALALVLGVAASLPMKMVGSRLSEHASQMNVPAAAEFASEATVRYLNQIDLSGAPPHVTDRVVMHIRCAQPMYWRGRVFNEYTGYSWTTDSIPQRMERGPEAWYTRPLRRFPPGEGEDLKREPLAQTVESYDPPIAGVLVAAAEPMAIAANGPLDQDSHRCVKAADGRTTMTYQVVSMISVASPRDLMHAGTQFPLALKATYTQLYDEGNEPEARRQIAEQVTAGLKTEYEKVKALETYLRDNFEYTLTPPRTPSNMDAVTFFLTDSKVGYCEAFASAMAVLCREVDIPARMVTGFAPGTPSSRSHPGMDPVWIIRERDLHAWTEVYFPGYGWIGFDPTSSRMAHVSWSAVVGNFVRNLLSGVSARTSGPLLVVLALAAVGVFLLKSYAVDPLRCSAWWRIVQMRLRPASVSPEDRWHLGYARLLRRLRRAAGARQPHQTAWEYAACARGMLSPAAADALDAVTAIYVRGAFQEGGPTEVDAAAFIEGSAALKAALKGERRGVRAPAPNESAA